MQPIERIAYQIYFGLPLAGWLGILTYISMILTASVMLLTRKQVMKFSFSTHKNLARITIILATIHLIFAISIYL